MLTSPTKLTEPGPRSDANLRRANFGMGKSRPARVDILHRYTPAPALENKKPAMEPETAPERRLKPGFPLLVAGISTVMLLAIALVSFNAGMEAVRHAAGKIQTQGTPASGNFPPGLLAEFDAAMDTLRKGASAEALSELQRLRNLHPEASMLDHAVALAALQAGDFSLAETAARASIARGERKADSLALLAAALSSDPTTRNLSFTKPSARDLEILKEAIAADPLNPNVRIELAGRLRETGSAAEALAQLHAARNLLVPVESATAIDASIAILQAEAGEPLSPPAGPASAIARALLASRSGDLAAAAGFLTEARQAMPPETFSYLRSDPALKRLADEPALAEILGD